MPFSICCKGESSLKIECNSMKGIENMENMEPLISVIVPIYNVEKYLNKCVDSIISQTYKNLEIILVDDGSPDNCPKMCDEYVQKDNRIKVIHKKNGGLSDARNAGIDAANGEYIAFVDSDDYIEVNMYEKLYNVIKEYDANIAVCSRYIVSEKGERYSYISHDADVLNMDAREALKRIFSFKDFDMSACDKLYDIKLFENIRYPYDKLNEDYYVTPQLFHRSKKIVYIPVPLYNYLQRNGSITKSKEVKTDVLEASNYLFDFYKKNYNDILYVADTMVAFAYISIANRHIANSKEMNKELKKEAKIKVRQKLSSVLKNENISISKKMQVVLFAISINLYSGVYRIFKK